jgi:hypothetical protein
MKYLYSESYSESFRVRLDGPEEEQKSFGCFVENMLGENVKTGQKHVIPRVHDTPAGIVVRFNSNKEFKKMLVWRSIFNQRDPNKQFNFMRLARKAIEEVKEIMDRDLIENMPWRPAKDLA